MESSQKNASSPEKKPLSFISHHARRFEVPKGSMLLLLLLLGGLIFGKVLLPGNTPQNLKAQKPKGPPPRPVETTLLKGGTAEKTVLLLGQVQATQQSTLRAQTSGILKQIIVQPGDRVKAGMVVAILEDTDQQLAIAQAKANLSQEKSQLARLEVGTRPEIIAQKRAAVNAALAREREAQDNLKRIGDLVSEGALSQRTLVEAQARLDESQGRRLEAAAALAEAKAGPIQEEIEAQKANLALAQAQLAQAQLAQRRTRILSSQTGIVQARSVSQGDLIQMGSPIITLVAGDRVDVFLELPEDQAGKVTPAMPITLKSRALPQWQQPTTITAVIPSADSTSRRQLVRVQLDNPPVGLLPGMAVTGNLSLPSNRVNFLVSRDVLTRRDNQWLIFTVKEGKAQPIAVEVVADLGQTVGIYHRDLKEGQEIVLRGGDALQDGTKVKILDKGGL